MMSNLLNTVLGESTTYQTFMSIKRDASNIHDALSLGYKDTTTKVQQLKRQNIYVRRLLRWFDDKSAADEQSSFDEDLQTNDEFESSQQQVSESEMQTIHSDHIKEIHQFGKKQVETKLQLTSEIVTVIDDRAMETLSSLRNTSTLTKTIMNRLDVLIESKMSYADKMRRENDNSIFNQNGMITINSIKQYFSNMLKVDKKSLSQRLMQVLDLTNLDERVTDTIQNAQSRIVMMFFDIPLIKKFIDPFKRSSKTNYALDIQNDYTQDRAIFDNATRKTIVSIIPAYLQIITYQLTDQVYRISSKGHLSTNQNVGFGDTIRETFNIKMISDKHMEPLIQDVKRRDEKISVADIKEAQRIMVSQYVYVLYKKGIAHLNSKFFEDGGDPRLQQHVLVLISSSKNDDYKKWNRILLSIQTQLMINKKFREQFTNAINYCIHALHTKAREYAMSSDGSERLQFTRGMFDRYARERLKHDSSAFEFDGKSLSDLVHAGIIKKSWLTVDQMQNYRKPIFGFNSLEYTLTHAAYEETHSIVSQSIELHHKYLYGIFTILNRGVNVVFMKHPFKQMKAPKLTQQDVSKPKSKTKTKDPMLDVPKPKASHRFGQPASIFQKAKNMLKRTFTNASEKVESANKLISYGKSIKQLLSENKWISTRKGIGQFLSDIFSGSNDDSMKQKEVLASMKTVSQDGEMSDEDVFILESSVNKMKDLQLKNRLRSVIDRVKRGLSKTNPKNTVVGKVIFSILGSVKSYFSNIFSFARRSITSLLSWAGKSLISSGKKISSGAKAVKEGFLGIKGTLVKDPGRLKRNIKRIYRASKTIIKSLPGAISEKSHEFYEKHKEGIDRVKNRLSESWEATKEDLSKKGIAAKKIGSTIKQIGLKPVNLLKNTKFGQGVSDALKKDDQSTASMSLMDRKSSAIDRLLKNTDSSRSFLGNVFQVIQNVLGQITDWFDTLKSKITGKEKKKREDPTNLKKGIRYNLGKMTGGILKILSSLMKPIMQVVATMKGLTKITGIVEDVLQKSLKPLNKVFFTIVNMLKPIVKIITKILSSLVSAISDVIKSIISSIQPILEAINPIIESLLSVLEPILTVITTLIESLVTPLTLAMKIFVVPKIRLIATNLQLQCGILQVGMGLIITVLGGILCGVGLIGKLFGAGALYDTGKTMIDTGITLTTAGASNVAAAMVEYVDLIGYGLKTIYESTGFAQSAELQSNKSEQHQKQTIPTITGSPMDGTYGSGDTSTIAFSENVQDALGTLRSIVKQITSIFMGDDDDVASRLHDETEKEAYKQAQVDAADLTDEEKQQVDTDAFEMFKKDYPKEENESDADYKKRYEKKKSTYWTLAATTALKKKVNASPGGTDSEFTKLLDTSVGDSGFLTGFSDKFNDYNNQTQRGSAATQFADTMSTYQSTSSGGYVTEGYDKEDLIKNIAMIYEAYRIKNPSNILYHNELYDYPITLRNGKTRKIRPDCSGIVSAGIQEMGYQLKQGGSFMGETGVRSWTFAGGKPFIFDKSGNQSDDWIILPFSKDILQRGDITARFSKAAGKGHVSFPIVDLDKSKPRGLDGGGNTNIIQSAKASVAYLDGEQNIPWREAMGANFDGSSAQYIIRYVGKPITRYIGSNAENTNMSDQEVWSYLTKKIGMSEFGTAGMMGIMKEESGMKSNNLEDIYNAPAYFGMSDEQYTNAVNKGRESEKQFVTGRNYTRYSHQTPGEAVGYGLAQFTSSSLKQDLYNRTVKQGKSIADMPSQLDMLASQLKKTTWDGKTRTGKNGPSLFDWIKNAQTVDDARKYFLWRYVAGVAYTSDAGVAKAYGWTGNQLQKRKDAAQNFYNKFHGSGDTETFYDQSIIINQFINESFILEDHLEKIQYAEFDIEASNIQSLMNSIFDELPAYLEDDEDDEIFEEESVFA